MSVAKSAFLTLEEFLNLPEPEFCHQQDSLTVIDGVDLELTVEELFGWLKMKLN